MSYETFTNTFFPAAYQAYVRFGIHPLATLSQAALESAWAESNNYKNAYNLFGMTMGGGTPNEFWDGAANPNPGVNNIRFRKYSSPAMSIMDYGRMMKANYSVVVAASQRSIDEFAHAIAYSPYISESNGDNRPNYESGIKARAAKITAYVDALMASATHSSGSEKKN